MYCEVSKHLKDLKSRKIPVHFPNGNHSIVLPTPLHTYTSSLPTPHPPPHIHTSHLILMQPRLALNSLYSQTLIFGFSHFSLPYAEITHLGHLAQFMQCQECVCGGGVSSMLGKQQAVSQVSDSPTPTPSLLILEVLSLPSHRKLFFLFGLHSSFGSVKSECVS